MVLFNSSQGPLAPFKEVAIKIDAKLLKWFCTLLIFQYKWVLHTAPAVVGAELIDMDLIHIPQHSHQTGNQMWNWIKDNFRLNLS